MPDVQEVFRMATQKVRPEPGFVERQFNHQRKRQRNRKLGAIAVAAAICVAAVAVILSARGGPTKPTPASSNTIGPQVDVQAIEVATNFVDLFGVGDTEGVYALLDPIVDLHTFGDTDGALRRTMLWLQAAGYEQTFDGCTQVSPPGVIVDVQCSISFHLFGSEQIGRGPFTGSTLDLSVRDGKVISAALNFELSKFSPQMWEPFRDWVRATYPKDFKVMYINDGGEESHTDRSNALWEEHVADYVRYVNG
jgi:hypothetical protein